MRREFARSRRGQRAYGTRPFKSWKTVSIVGAIRLGRKPRLMTHSGSVDGRLFFQFVRRRLVPWIRPGDVVVMDNLNAHKMVKVRAAIEAAGATPVYLPTYSPELNPIEMLWADLKRDLRSLALNEEPALKRGIRRLRRRVPLSKIEGWFRKSARHAQLN